jgi:hypothetical protein
MDEYLNKYDSLNKIIVYDFKLGYGGIGDLLKFFIYLINYGIKNNIKIHYLINDIPLEKYLKLKYNFFYIKYEDIHNKIKIMDVNELSNIEPNIYYIIEPSILYNIILYETMIPYELVFEFPEIVKINCRSILDTNLNNYISLHLRLGDKYLETDQNYIQCLYDTRDYNEEKIFKFIEENQDKNIIFFCDNNTYKLKIKKKYNNIIITNCKIGHTSLTNTTEKQVLDSITEFYLMTNSDEIIMSSQSGFPITASKFKNIPIKYLY